MTIPSAAHVSQTTKEGMVITEVARVALDSFRLNKIRFLLTSFGTVLGVNDQYETIRNLDVLAGRFFEADDVQQRAKVAAVTKDFAEKTFGSPAAAVGQGIKIGGLPFVIIGVFRERVETFGQSELA